MEREDRQIAVARYDLLSQAQRYLNAQPFLFALRRYDRVLSVQQYKTLRGQALAGDIDGAAKGLARLLNENRR